MHDGSPLDANDVKYTVDRAFDATNPSVTKASWGPISSGEVIDPLTVMLTLDKPFVALVPFLADSFSTDRRERQQGEGTSSRHHDGDSAPVRGSHPRPAKRRQDRPGEERGL